MTGDIWAVVVCGGRGERMGGAINKTLLPVAGVPCVARVVRAFRACGASVALVVRPSEREMFSEALARFGERADLYADAGYDRQQSVYHGLLALPGDADIALVHDGARGLVTRDLILRVIDSVRAFGSGVAALPVTDTVKLADGDGVILETLDRQSLRAVQTPQGFRYRELLRAHRIAAGASEEKGDSTLQGHASDSADEICGQPQGIHAESDDVCTAGNDIGCLPYSIDGRTQSEPAESSAVCPAERDTLHPADNIGEHPQGDLIQDDRARDKRIGASPRSTDDAKLSATCPRATDDAALMEAQGFRVRLVQGEKSNVKLTTPEDIRMAEAYLGKRTRVGHGYDAHRLVCGRRLFLGGVEIPYEMGLLGHSDADAALHALTDALFGAAALGDIGTHFPDSDEAYRGASSLELLKKADDILRSNGFIADSVDLTIVAQRPKLSPFIPEMRRMIAAALRLDIDSVSVKATTTEGMGFEGRGEGISAHAVAVVGQYAENLA